MQINQYTLTLKQIGSLELDKKKGCVKWIIKKNKYYILNKKYYMNFRMKKKEREKRINNIHTKDCMGKGNEN